MTHLPAFAAALAAAVVALPAAARAEVFTYEALLSGANEVPANDSSGTGYGLVTWDTEAHTAAYAVTFQDLLSSVTGAATHIPRGDPPIFPAVTTSPNYPGFPIGVVSGSWSAVIDLTSPASYTGSFLVASGGSTAAAEAALLYGLETGLAYLNIRTVFYPGGEIRGTWTKVTAAPAPEPAAWALMLAGFAAAGAALRRRGTPA